MDHPLDNPAFNALASGNSDLSLGTAVAKYFPTDISPFAGVEQVNRMEELYQAIPGPGMFAFVSPVPVSVPAPWKVAASLQVFQMLYKGVPKPVEPGTSLQLLGEAQVDEMLELTARTNPGPFFKRTLLFGHYLGIFRDSRLVAMAGYRMHACEYIEISAVCTDPLYTGMGYAQILLAAQVNSILEQGKIPFLHVKTTNMRAIDVYYRFGFETRKELIIYSIVK
jgi:ribosomal protein S18 acetylase RimI-like enzyme